MEKQTLIQQTGVSIEQAKRITILAFKRRRAVLWAGRPGIGKTEAFKQIAKELGADIIWFFGAIADPTDLKGYPAILNGKATHVLFSDILQLFEDSQRPIIFFLDDFGQSPTLVQAGAMQLILERRINGYRITNPNVYFAIATNRAADKAGVSGILETIKSRGAVIPVAFSHEGFISWGLDNNVSSETLGFNKFRPDLLSNWTPRPKEITASRTPRTVVMYDEIFQDGIPEQDNYQTCNAFCEEDYAIEWIEFLKVMYDLPTKEEIYMNPDTAKLPKESNLSARYAVALNLGRHVSESNVEASIKYMERIKQEELLIMMLKDGVRTNRACANTKAFIKAVNKYQNLLV